MKASPKNLACYIRVSTIGQNEAGQRAAMRHLVGHPPLAFLRNYLARGGFRDGIPGFIVSAMNAYYVFLKFAKLWAVQHQSQVQGSTFKVQGSVQGSGFKVHESERVHGESLEPKP